MMANTAGQGNDTAALLARRDKRAWREFYHATITRIYNFAYYKLRRDHHAAEEVTQEVYLNAYSMIGRYEGKGALEDWLIGVTKRRIADYLRKRKAGRMQGFEESIASGGGLSPEELLARREVADAVNAAMAELPVDYARVLELKYVEKKSVREVGHRIGSTEKAAESMLTRARQALKRSLEASVGAPAVTVLLGAGDMLETSVRTMLDTVYEPVAPSEAFVKMLGESIISIIEGGGIMAGTETAAARMGRNATRALVISGIVAALLVCCLMVVLTVGGTVVPHAGSPAPDAALPAVLGNGDEEPAEQTGEEKTAGKSEEAGKGQPKEDKPEKTEQENKPADEPAGKPEQESALWSTETGVDALCREAELVVIAKYEATVHADGRRGSHNIDEFSVEKILRGETGHRLWLRQYEDGLDDKGQEYKRTFFTRPGSSDGRYIIFIRRKSDMEKKVMNNVVLIAATAKNINEVQNNPWFGKQGKKPLMLDLTAGPGHDWMSRTQTYKLGMEVGQILTVSGRNVYSTSSTWKFKEAKVTSGDGIVAIERKEEKVSRYTVVLKALTKGDATVEFRHDGEPKVAAVLKINVGREKAVEKIIPDGIKFPGFEGSTADNPLYGWDDNKWKTKLFTVRREDVRSWLRETENMLKIEEDSGEESDCITQSYLQAAMCHHALGDKGNAVKYYRKAAEFLDPNRRARVESETFLFYSNTDKLLKVVEKRIQELTQ